MAARSLVTAWIAILAAVFVPALMAQEAPTMLATGRYLFVLRGEWLLQFDVDTLELKQRKRIETPAPPGQPVRLQESGADAPRPASREVTSRVPPAEAGMAGGRWGGRTRGDRVDRRLGEAIDRGLQWLARHQDEDGKWDADGFMKHDKEGEACDGPGNPVHDVGVTGLAMLALLGDGNTLRNGPYQQNLRNGVKWLQGQQDDRGRFGGNASHDFIYDHAIATYAICEAYGLSGYALLKPVAQRGIDYLESHRNPYSVWRYQPRDNDNDTSVTSWCLIACASGKHFGLEVNDNALKLGLTWIDQVTSPDGRVGYSKRGEPSSRHPGDHARRFPPEKGEAMTAAALFCRFFLGQEPKQTPIMRASADLIMSKPPKWDEQASAIDHYYWYYATLAMFQVGGRHWSEWSTALNAALLDKQRKDGNPAGSWDPVGVWGEDGGRIYSTALCVLSLEASYRYTRLVR